MNRIVANDAASETAAHRRRAEQRLRISEIFHSLQGEADAVGWPHRVRAPDRLPAALRLVRYRIRVPRRRVAHDRRDPRRSRHARRAPRLRHRRRAAGAETLPVAARATVRCRLRSLAGNFRRDRCRRGRSARAQGRRPQGAGIGRSRAQPVVEPRPPAARTTRSRSSSPIAPTTNGRARASREHALHARCQVLFSPVHAQLAPRELAEWILADRLPVRFQMQLHKLLWERRTPGSIDG